jgi:hypothetical protein
MGYKYYMPKGLYQYDSGANYAILASDDNYYYLYFDLLSYLNKEKITYTAKEELYYSKAISYEDKLGYVEITKKENDKYLIEIMYNYAKIEVIVDEDEIKSSLANTINILNSIKYNKNVITKLLEEDSLTSTEEVYKLFDKVKKNSDILDYVEGINVSDEDVIKDTDFID